MSLYDKLVKELKYDKNTGQFYKRDSNKKLGTDDGNGYLTIWFAGKNYRAHRLAWFYVYKKWPINNIIHKDGNLHNNAIENLKEVTVSERMILRSIRSDNTSGAAGVYFAWGKWHARAQYKHKIYNLGAFKDIKTAMRARNNKLNALGVTI